MLRKMYVSRFVELHKGFAASVDLPSLPHHKARKVRSLIQENVSDGASAVEKNPRTIEKVYSASIPSGFRTTATEVRTDQQRIDHLLITCTEKKKKELNLL